MKTPLRWAGGKSRFSKLIDEKVKNFDPRVNRYFEPFFGSGSYFFWKEINGVSYINDLNSDLINFYTQLRDNPNKLYWAIRNLYAQGTEKHHYAEIKKAYNKSKNTASHSTTILNAARFFYLNRTGFNGIYRVNMKGEYNVPHGKSDPLMPDVEEFAKASELLHSAVITSTDYTEVLTNARSGDLVYLDPPYFPGESSMFTGYTDPKFTKKNNIELIELAYNLKINGVNVIISNAMNEELIRIVEDYNIFNIQVINPKRNINPNASNKEKFAEVLIY